MKKKKKKNQELENTIRMFCGHSLLTGLSKPCDFDKPRSRILSISLIDFTVSKG